MSPGSGPAPSKTHEEREWIDLDRSVRINILIKRCPATKLEEMLTLRNTPRPLATRNLQFLCGGPRGGLPPPRRRRRRRRRRTFPVFGLARLVFGPREFDTCLDTALVYDQPSSLCSWSFGFINRRGTVRKLYLVGGRFGR